MSPNETLLTKPDIAERLGISVEGVEKKMRESDGIPYLKLGYRTVRFRWADVVRWLEDRTVNPVDEGEAA